MIVRHAENRLADRLPAAEAPRHVVSETHQINVLQSIWRRKWSVAVVIAVCLVAAYMIVKKTVPIYRSQSRIYIEPSATPILREQAQVAISDGYLSLQCELIRSRGLLAKVAAEPEVLKLRTIAGSHDAVSALMGGLDTSYAAKDGIIVILFSSPDPGDAAFIANRIVRNYILYQEDATATKSNEVLRILKGEKDRRENDLMDLERRSVEFRRENGVLAFDAPAGNIILERLDTLSKSLTNAEMETIRLKSLDGAVQPLRDDPAKLEKMIASEPNLFPPGTDSEVGVLQAKLAEQRQQLDDAVRSGLGPENARRRYPTEKIPELEAQIKDAQSRAAKRSVEVLHASFQRAQQQEDALRKAYDEQQRLALDLNAKEAEFLRLDSETRRVRDLLNLLDNRIKEIDVSNDVKPVKIGILEEAMVSAGPVSPDKPRTMTLALAVGLLLGVGAALVQEWTDQRVRSAAEVRSNLLVQVLGVVPRIRGRGGWPVVGQKVHLEPLSSTAEAYRTIRTSVFFAAQSEEAKLLLVCSPDSGDGKTVTASNLAIAIAHAGQRTLILDGDFRSPTVHKVFGVDDTMGLSSVLSEGALLSGAIQRSNIKGLDILPCGPIPPNPSEILNSRRFALVLEKLSQHYKYIVIDSAPVMRVPDARIIAGMEHVMTILVLRANKSTRRVALDARDALLSVGARILGGVINDVQRVHGYYTSYGRYEASLEERAIARASLPPGATANGNGNGATGAPAGNGNGAHPDDGLDLSSDIAVDKRTIS